MLTIFNRKRLGTILSMKRQAEIRAALSHAGIAYCVKAEYAAARTRGPQVSFAGDRMGVNSAESTLYTFYVHRKQYELAAKISGLGY